MNHDQLLKQIQRRPRVHGYTAPATETKKSPIDGLGLFAKEKIAKDTVVAAWGGVLKTKAEIESLDPVIGYNYALEIYPGFYLAETSIEELDSSDFINHSCDPNCEIVNKFIMRTKRDIGACEELTADFSNHSDHGEKFICHCGAPNCRGVIYFD